MSNQIRKAIVPNNLYGNIEIELPEWAVGTIEEVYSNGRRQAWAIVKNKGTYMAVYFFDRECFGRSPEKYLFKKEAVSYAKSMFYVKPKPVSEVLASIGI